MRRLGVILVLFFTTTGLSLAQSGNAYLSLDFALDNQTYTWADSLMLFTNLGQFTTVQFHNRSTATLIKKSVFGDGEDRWQKLARSTLAVNRSLSQSLTTGLELRQDFERLEKRRFIGNGALAVADLHWGRVRLLQKGGVTWEQRESDPEKSTQSGFGYEGEVSLLPRGDGSLGRLAIEGDLTTHRQTPRKSIALLYDVSGSLTGRDTTTLSAGQTFGEKKYFPRSDDFDLTARQRIEQRHLDLDLRRELPAAVYFRAQAAYRFSSYKYDYDTPADELIAQTDNLRSLFEYHLDFSRDFGKRLLLTGEYLYNRSKEDFGLQQVNQLSETGRLAGTASLRLGVDDSLQVSGQIGVTSYTAPKTSEFFSDRDRTIKVASFRAAHRFTRFLRATLDGSYRGFHTIYVSGTLSANNNVNNIFILNPSLVWSPTERVTLEQDYQLHANYIYYDFEKSSLAGRNTIYRRANFSNRLTVKTSAKTDFIIEYGYRYEDFGPVRYTDQWQQQVSWDRRTHRPKFTLDFHPSSSFRFRPFAAYEIRRSYDHLFDPDNTLGRREQTEEFSRKQIGFDLQIVLSRNSYIDCSLERRIQEYQNQRNQDYDVFTIALKKRL